MVRPDILRPLGKPDSGPLCLARRPREAAAALGISEQRLWKGKRRRG